MKSDCRSSFRSAESTSPKLSHLWYTARPVFDPDHDILAIVEARMTDIYSIRLQVLTLATYMTASQDKTLGLEVVLEHISRKIAQIHARAHLQRGYHKNETSSILRARKRYARVCGQSALQRPAVSMRGEPRLLWPEVPADGQMRCGARLVWNKCFEDLGNDRPRGIIWVDDVHVIASQLSTWDCQTGMDSPTRYAIPLYLASSMEVRSLKGSGMW